MTRNSWMPIRKILVAAVAFVLSYIALRLGVDLGDAEVNQAALGIVTLLAGYLVPTPRSEVLDAAQAEPTITVVDDRNPGRGAS